MKPVIFTDLDGTLLDHETYSFAKAKQALAAAKKLRVPVIFCTSKTRSEIEFWRRRIGNTHPFISENGGAIFIPKGYFSFRASPTTTDGYETIVLGTPYNKLLSAYRKLKSKFDITGFSDMTVKELMSDAGLSRAQAEMAKQREFDEVIKLNNPSQEKDLLREIRRAGLKYSKGGRYYHIHGSNDKGRAVKILAKLYRNEYGKIITIGLGDSPNDFPMLNSVKRPYLVMRPNRRYSSSEYLRAGAPGPEGWNRAVLKELAARGVLQ